MQGSGSSAPSGGGTSVDDGITNGTIGSSLVGFQPGPQSETDCLVRASSSDDDESETSNDQPATIQVHVDSYVCSSYVENQPMQKINRIDFNEYQARNKSLY